MKRVLVVDDDRLIVDLIQEVLEDEGYVVQTALGGADALANMNECWPDVVLVDFRMPGMDGLTFLELCRADPRAKDLRVVLMSAMHDGPPALDSAAAAYLAKPFDIDTLLGTLATLLARMSVDLVQAQMADDAVELTLSQQLERVYT